MPDNQDKFNSDLTLNYTDDRNTKIKQTTETQKYKDKNKTYGNGKTRLMKHR